MPDPIQRVARGWLEILSSQGGRTPTSASDVVQGFLDLLQMYGLQQLQTLETNDPAAAENVSVVVTPSARTWSVLFQAQCRIVKTATMTACRASIAMQRTTLITDLRSEELGPFGATETGSALVTFWAPYPILMPPGTQIVARTTILGTDATADTTCRCEFGLLG